MYPFLKFLWVNVLTVDSDVLAGIDVGPMVRSGQKIVNSVIGISFDNRT
ncbi:hypothetical protein SAMN03159507_03645 [Pseudomonas sp. NFACC32-1]|nr:MULTISPECIES: hypothetical protein [unclassified Pseudomonas]SCX68209.1 hypothetical protein SAMN03159507_03645 [Pseudomonas sp. NFACC32-1]SFX69980.1 hypothetical protein SAMN03159390_02248 [Pseudomonas sp. NFACC49-2]